MSEKRVIVGASGASGMPVLIKCLELLKAAENIHTSLIMTESAIVTMRHESSACEAMLPQLADEIYDVHNIGEKPASGSYHADGMLIVPCSMKTLAGIHSGYADNLLLRAADVTMKEQRTLVLGVRESPFHAIHLRNMQELSLMNGVRIMPLMMSFYEGPQSVDDMVTHMAAKLVEPFGVEVKEYRRWNGL